MTRAAGPAVSERAARVYRDAIVIDMHNDLAHRMLEDGYDPNLRHEPGFGRDRGQTDLPRLVESGITAQFFAAFVDAACAAARPDRSWARAVAALDAVHAFVRAHPDRLIAGRTSHDIRRAKQEGKVAVFLAVEGGHAIENSLDSLRALYTRGVRYLTLTWNNGNDWAGSSIGVNGTRTGGLTDFGRQVVREMNAMGMLVDVSHASNATVADVLAVATAPVIASHSCAHALNPHPRNLTDDQLRAVAATGGVVNVNFFALFLDAAFGGEAERIRAEMAALEAESLGRDASAGEEVRATYTTRTAERLQALPRVPLSALIDHIDHIARVAGVDHTGLGSDFDGVDGLLPVGMEDVTCLPRIAQGLIDRGYSDGDVARILGGNMVRVIEAVLDRGGA